MNLSFNVKLLVLISFIIIKFTSLCLANSIIPKLDCGLYEVHGTLKLNSKGQFIIKVQEKSYAQIELLVLGGSFSEMMMRRNTQIKATVQISKVITSDTEPFVYLQNLMPPNLKKENFWIREIKKTKCGISDDTQ